MSNINDLTSLLNIHSEEIKKDINTCIPGVVISFDKDTQLASLQIGINMVDNHDNQYKHAPIISCPVFFVGNANYIIEHEINEGDEGILVFSQRCMDNWVADGGTVNQDVIRFHDINDAMFIPGIRSQKNKIENFGNDGIKLRDKNNSNFVWLKNDGTIIIKTNKLIVDGDIINNGINVTQHDHSQANDSGGNTEQDTGKMK